MDKTTGMFFGWIAVCFMLPIAIISLAPESVTRNDNNIRDARMERDRIYIIERGAEDDASDKALSEHQEVNYVRCFLRPAGYVTCQVHTPAVDVEARCRARGAREYLVDGNRCHWLTPDTMAHP